MAFHRPSPSIEPLESRIAPALLINGANLLGGSSPATGETSVGGNSAELIHVTSGQAIVWYQDGAILGISFGPNTSLDIHGNVLGDIVGNLRADGRLSDSDNQPLNGEDGAILLPNNLIGLTTAPLGGQKGDVGAVITAGSISKVKIAGELYGLYAGDGVFRSESRRLEVGAVITEIGFDYNPIQSGVQSEFTFTRDLAQTIDPAQKLTGMLAGASISDIDIAKAVELQAFAGSGNPNDLTLTKAQAGGSIKKVTIQSAFSRVSGAAVDAPASYELRAGDGSSGAVGGAGGGIDSLVETTSSGQVIIFAGNGGSGVSGAGGAGGNVTNTDAGSDSSRYFVNGGLGGNGLPGGAGGSLLNNNFSNRSPIGGLLVAGDFDDDGAEDIIVVNQGTGEMVVQRNTNLDGTNFAPITQYFDDDLNAITVITDKGDTPIGAFAAYVDSNDTLDLVVAYKNSDNLGIFLNQGGGKFWDPTLDNGDGDYAGFTVSLTFSPAKIAASSDQAGSLIVAENTAEGKSILHSLRKVPGTDTDVNYALDTGANKLSLPVTDMVTVGDSSVILSTTDGKLLRVTRTGLTEGAPFEVTDTLQKVAGGISDLDVDSSGDRLVALSTSGHSFSIFDFSSATPSTPLSLEAQVAGLQGKQLVAKFVHDGDSATLDQLAVLSGFTTTSKVDLYTSPATGGTPALVKTVTETQSLKNFQPVYSEDFDAGFAAISSSLGQFTFSDGFLSGVEYTLPFDSKRLEAHAGAGGDGINFQPATGALKSGKGGAGGSISALNAEANQMVLEAGAGGASTVNAGGAGGSISNPATFTTATGVLVKPTLQADELLSITAGNGGAPATAGSKAATGGAGGSLSNLVLDLRSGDLALLAGNGGDSRGGAAGTGGSISGITDVLHDGSLTVTAGDGGTAFLGATPATGSAVSGAGGKGGAVLSLSHELTLDSEVENDENPYTVTIVAGAGGNSVTSAGGDGGAVQGVKLKLDEANITYDDPFSTPALVDAHKDSTLTTTITAGAAGNGAKGGLGGSIGGLKFDMVLDQITPRGVVKLGGAVLGLTAGAGGNGSAGNGGNGGSVLLTSALSGLSFLDPDAVLDGPTGGLPLVIIAGAGGDGSVKGGLGGGIDGVTAQNQLFIDGAPITLTHLTGAALTAGAGGDGGTSDGGKGGSITNSLLGVQNLLFDTSINAQPVLIDLLAGAGGRGGLSGATLAPKAKGGAGGSIVSGEFGLVSTNAAVGITLEGGKGGAGILAGGAGGVLSTIKLNASQSTDSLSAILLGGDGGLAALATGLGGKGGDITGITQAKDVNSSINLLQAGDGGANSLGKGGAGGSVTTIRTVGFIGRPSDNAGSLGVFDLVGSTPIPQGIFAGHGGAGSTTALAGVNGSVSNVSARQIAAIAAAIDGTGHFTAAAKVTNIKADLIGYDADRGDGTARDGVYNDALGGTASPSGVNAQDGFILSETALVNVIGQRTGFVFIEPKA